MIPLEDLDQLVLQSINELSQRPAVLEAVASSLLEQELVNLGVGPLAVEWSVNRLIEAGCINIRKPAPPYYEIIALTIKASEFLGKSGRTSEI